MEIYLTYQGTISTRGHAKEKFKHRRSIHDQLQNVWNHHKEMGIDYKHTFCPEKIKCVGDFRFLPLVTKSCHKIIDLEFTVLSNCEPGCDKQYPTGDIDNILKVLIDGLRMAQTMNEVRDEKPHSGENPFLCLLEDDQMIRNINIRHEKLYFPKGSSKGQAKEIFVLIRVMIYPKSYYV